MTVLVQLYPHQVVCRDWLIEKQNTQKGAIIGLAMGLGKTAIGMSLIDENDTLPTIVFAPVGLLHQWKFECEDKTNLKCLLYHGKSRKDFEQRLLDEKPHVILASFGSARDPQLQSRQYQRMIVDEIHYIRNIGTVLFKALCEYNTEYRIGLTGTPLVNGTFDLFSYCLFLKVLDIPHSRHQTSGNKRAAAIERNQLKKQFAFRLDRGLMHQVMLQMSLKDCNLDVALTPLHEQVHTLVLSDTEMTIYQRLERRIGISAVRQQASENSVLLLSYIVYLRQASNHLSLVKEQIVNGLNEEETKFVNADVPGTKTQKCIDIIEQIPNDEKVIVFSEFLGMMGVIGKQLDKVKIPYLFYIGPMTLQERNTCIRNFHNHNGKIVLIASKMCLSVGLNLTVANHVILLSEWFHTTLDKQCIARTYRLGQTKPVHVHRLMSLGTIDERIHEIARKKEEEIKAKSSGSELTLEPYLRQTNLTEFMYMINIRE